MEPDKGFFPYLCGSEILTELIEYIYKIFFGHVLPLYVHEANLYF
jgi:hypothetical protein